MPRLAVTPLFAAMVNAAASHFAEQDDVHNGSVFHPAAVVFPPALAVAQALGRSGRELLAAAVAGYEVGIRVGEFLGRSHYRCSTPPAPPAPSPPRPPPASAAASTPSGCCMPSARPAPKLRVSGSSCATPPTPSSSIPRTPPPPGSISAYLALDGFTGAQRILEGRKGIAAGMSSDADPARLIDRLGTRWALAETSFKFHASCRHTHPAADALLHADDGRTACAPSDIAAVTAHVHQGGDRRARAGRRSADGAPFEVLDGHRARPHRRARPRRPHRLRPHWHDADVIARSATRVAMALDAGDRRRVSGALDRQGHGRDRRRTRVRGARRRAEGRPGQQLSRAEIEDKAERLAAYRDGASRAEIARAIERIRALRTTARVGFLLS